MRVKDWLAFEVVENIFWINKESLELDPGSWVKELVRIVPSAVVHTGDPN